MLARHNHGIFLVFIVNGQNASRSMSLRFMETFLWNWIILDSHELHQRNSNFRLKGELAASGEWERSLIEFKIPRIEFGEV